ncbi:hypothetical protein JOC95_003116 [Bacillus tianshenii]|uniref:DUF308 domain-containing protein n=1 Tax=Sutcliffiella tianshenii TaxID=1463404 RepID=A0ABS2P2S1_9BACI|nr:hypothetical protein [Bacillus tianshenii]MBM7621243.1 hypothetical protein [Bacillus tianshenii]
MKNIPLIVTVGNVAILPYYIIWLKEASMTYTLFAWFFAMFSFAAAWGYRVYQAKKNKGQSFIFLVYTGMGALYLAVGLIRSPFDSLPYVVLFIQVLLGFQQGYFRAWHIEQKEYHLHAVHHYLLVGFAMIGLSLVNVLSPSFFLNLFGCLLLVCAVGEILRKKDAVEKSIETGD